MAKNKKTKNTHRQKINPLIRLALGNELKKHIESPEEREKVMQVFAGLDMKTLMSDPEALARVMANPAGELRNFVKEGVDPDAEISKNSDAAENTNVEASRGVEEIKQTGGEETLTPEEA